ncbi:hypothetical protein Despr_0424 [Desulfobulbus propionicus DSM 2032]|jgi:hypothetical protein|uniref:Uncharacterized protein n=1 Tax=Desulfobulbus propionicus (strain ATCC 33891 / DSM 2032 / VKM B-1956 / 1pr3) TaxID=577650 RepID=A0A7U3YJM2_DESPD|nr:hypothetical protein [Desulfobulbus propionicus]ADW16605.1 hypothetical protein Despr_0424 [Desulfobulbus propionicus DSM 2032]
MQTITATLVLSLLLTGIFRADPVRADDLDDGITIDDSAYSYGNISSSSQNFSYLAQRARSKAASGSGDVVLSDSGALNSVILDAGAQINGDIIIIDDSSGDKTVISN